jgi:hypothetical protein
MKITLHAVRHFLFLAFFIAFSFPAMAQKGKKNDKLEKRKFDVEIKETTVEGKKYEKSEMEFSAKEVICDYFESKFKIQTIHYKTLTDSSYTDEGEQLKFFKVKGNEKGQKADEEWVIETEVKGKEITGTISLMKGDKAKRTWEFEGTQKN